MQFRICMIHRWSVTPLHAPDERMLALPSTIWLENVTIRIKGNDRNFQKLRPLLCGKSAYFQKAFQEKTFREGQEGILELEDMDEWLLECFIAWIYTGSIVYEPADATSSLKDLSGGDGDDDDEGAPADPATWSYESLFKLYVFADRYDTRTLRNDMMDVILQKGLQRKPKVYLWPETSSNAIAFDNLPESAALVRFIIDIHVYETESAETEAADTKVLLQLAPHVLAIIASRRMKLVRKLKCFNCLAGGDCNLKPHEDMPAEPDFRIDVCRYIMSTRTVRRRHVRRSGTH
ncbi:putative BTB/POZ domain-containing protein [Septoria linicola]|nr:putative BTB/POZ domain-containing protein [Septoria linicola]